MILRRALLGLPTALLLLARVQAEDVHEPQEQTRQSQPWVVRKMSLDANEKFFPDQYFGFAADVSGDDSSPDSPSSRNPLSALFLPGRRRLPSLAVDGQREGHWPLAVRDAPPSPPPPPPPPSLSGNESAAVAEAAFLQTYLPPFSVHQSAEAATAAAAAAEADAADDAAAAATWHRVRRAARDVLDRLQRRQWGCPSGTASCSGIGYPYSCCGTDETCYLVTDTGLGPVGCCPSGSTCGGSISNCGSGSTACAASLGGGCCIAGYVCQGVGCVVSASTATTTSTAVGQPSTTVVTVIVTGGAGSVTTRTTTITTTPSPSTTTITSTAVASSSGGGVAPVKPTLTTTTSSSSSSSATRTATGTACPAGYYGCLASAGGGCCQTGRDCKTTGCPAAAASTTIVDAGGVTVVVPAADATATSAADTCASGWFLCGADAGAVAGCCPSGYACGTASCTQASTSSTGVVQKELPGATGRSGSGRSAAQSAAGWLAAAGWLGWLVL